MNIKHSMFSRFDPQLLKELKSERNGTLQMVLCEILKSRIANIDAPNEGLLEHPNWPLLRAYRDGRIKELTELLKAFDNPTTETK